MFKQIAPLQTFKQSRWHRRLLCIGAAFLVYVLVGFFVLPPIIKSQLVKRLPAITRRQAAARAVGQQGFERVEVIALVTLNAVLTTLRSLATQPDLGRRLNFRHPALGDIRSFRLASPFGVHLIFYRHNSAERFAERLMPGARDLPRRLEAGANCA